jgi:hypothetical protein
MSTITELSTYELVKSQSEIYNFEACGINVVNIDMFFVESFYKSNRLAYEYNIEFNFRNKDIKKIFYNFFILQLCNYIKTNKKKTVFYLNKTHDLKIGLREYFYIVKQCKRLLPILIYEGNICFKELQQRIITNDIETVSQFVILSAKLMRLNYTNFTFEKLSKFLKKNELIFLKDSYFTQHQIKLALLT